MASDSSHGIMFVGGDAEYSTGKMLQESIPSLKNMAGKTNLRENFAVLYHADLVICNSTMFMHVAAAFDIPNLVLLGPWYDSPKLHAQQWGHPLTQILGRELDDGRHQLTSPQDALSLARHALERATS